MASNMEQQPSACARFGKFLYNDQTSQFLGRKIESWIMIILFYLVYYGCLAAFFMGMMSVFLYGLIPNEKPYRTGVTSLLKLNPGLGYRPQPNPSTTLIAFSKKDSTTYESYVKELSELYDKYKKSRGEKCGDRSPTDLQNVCRFDWDAEMPNCSKADGFGYMRGQPCVLLKMNRIYGWLPEVVDKNVTHPLVECRGDNPADDENIGFVKYSPTKSLGSRSFGYFSNAFFPYLRQQGYLSPLVAVKFQRLRPNTVVLIECRLHNLNNVVYNKMDKQAMTHFEIFVRD